MLVIILSLFAYISMVILALSVLSMAHHARMTGRPINRIAYLCGIILLVIVFVSGLILLLAPR